MNLFIFLFQLLFSIPLFYIMEYFNKKKVSLIQKILIPVIYIILLTGIFNGLKPLVFIVVIAEVIVHDFYYNNISSNTLVNKKEFYISSFVSILLSIIIYNYYISKVDVVLPGAEDIKGFIWFLVILFLYALCKDNFKEIELDNKVKVFDRKQEYVIVSFAKLKNRFYKVVSSDNSMINRLIYSMMVYENFRVNKLARKINSIKYKFTDDIKKYGIMQVESDKELSDIDSIESVLESLEKVVVKKNIKEEEKINLLIKSRYSDEIDVNNVLDIYKKIEEFESR